MLTMGWLEHAARADIPLPRANRLAGVKGKPLAFPPAEKSFYRLRGGSPLLGSSAGAKIQDETPTEVEHLNDYRVALQGVWRSSSAVWCSGLSDVFPWQSLIAEPS